MRDVLPAQSVPAVVSRVRNRPPRRHEGMPRDGRGDAAGAQPSVAVSERPVTQAVPTEHPAGVAPPSTGSRARWGAGLVGGAAGPASCRNGEL